MTRANRSLAALMMLTALPTTVVGQEQAPSPFEHITATATATPVQPIARRLEAPGVPSTPQAFEAKSPATSGEIAGGAILGSIGSFGFMYAGAFAGWAVGDDYEGNYGGLMLGAAAGSVLGSTLGSSLALGNPGKALMGSLGGGFAGFLMAMGLSSLGQETLGVATFSIIQGTTAALVAGR